MRASLRVIQAQVKELRELRKALVKKGKWMEALELEPEYQRIIKEYHDLVRKESMQ